MEMKKIFLFSLLCFLGQNLYAQETAKQYFISFKDKQNSPYQLSRPEAYLSPRALERRQKQAIKINERDLPVNPDYLRQVAATGAHLYYSSKWFNGVLIEASEESLQKILQLPFVAGSPQVAKPKIDKTRKKENLLQSALKGTQEIAASAEAPDSELSIAGAEAYGSAYAQAQMIGADRMHSQGYRGKGMVIAVFDAGFHAVDRLPAFKHLFDKQQILGTWDFVMNEAEVYEDDDHGRMVLSCIAAYAPGKMIGTAPEASFYLFRTEDAATEYRIEEYHWLRAAEVADSLGVDIINSSLGYTQFDDKSTNYRYEDMNGKTAVISRAAEIAAQTGMIVVTSAGNEGGGSWRYVSAPADAPSVLSIGAVNSQGKVAYFSSRGKTADGRTKPDISALGQGTAVTRGDGSIGSSSGTSFSAPVSTGLVAGLWQAFPELSSQELMEVLRKSASMATQPNEDYGYGIPDFERAQALALQKGKKQKKQVEKQNPPQNTSLPESSGLALAPEAFEVRPVQVNRQSAANLMLYWGSAYKGKNLEAKLLDAQGRLIATMRLPNNGEQVSLSIFRRLPKGRYRLEVAPALAQKSCEFEIIE
jgi:subtilisin family serine protease